MALCPVAVMSSSSIEVRREEFSHGQRVPSRQRSENVPLPHALGLKRGEGGPVLQGGVSTPCGENRAVWGPRSPEHKNFSPESLGAEFRGGATVLMVMADPHAAFARAVKAGATVVWPVIFWPINVWPIDDKEYGWHVGRIVDPFGHHREIGKPLADG